MDRIRDWEKFNRQMTAHIEQYTIPQYQNENNTADQVGAWTSNDCVTSMQRYINRHGKNLRGPREALRDMLKIAHYAQLAYDKLRCELNEGNVYEE